MSDSRPVGEAARPPPRGRDVQLQIPTPLREFFARTIGEADGNEVYFLGKVRWDEKNDELAVLHEVDVMARGGRTSVNAIIDRAERWDIAFHNHPSGVLEPSDADMSVAHELANRSVGFAILSNDATRCYLVIPPYRKERARLVDADDVRRVFSEDGPLAEQLEDYELREGQLQMALSVAESLNQNHVLAAEAGTGVGKSFAYLVPAILWAKANERRVIVSTGTIHLQEQLVSKDLPFLRKVLEQPFRYTLIKGRGNYACRRKVAELADEFAQPSFANDSEEIDALRDLVGWAQADADGSRSSLAWIPERDVWERVMSETDRSLKQECEHYNECFFYSAKRRSFQADILVVNHALLFSDLAVRRETQNYQFDLILPAYDRVIFDEAHHLEDAASSHLGLRFTRYGMRQRLSRIRSPRSARRGVIPNLTRRLTDYGDPVAAKGIRNAYSTFAERGEAIEEHFLDIEDRLQADFLDGKLTADGAPKSTEDGAIEAVKVRFQGLESAVPFWEFAVEKLKAVQGELSAILRFNERALMSLRASTVSEQRKKSLLLELTSIESRLEGALSEIGTFCHLEDGEQVRWLSIRDAGGFSGAGALGCHAAPVRVDEILRDSLYDSMKSTVLTSATLCVNGKIDFFGDRLGLALLPESKFRFAQFASPFKYKEQVLTVVPADFPSPLSAEYTRSLPGAVYEILRASRGQAFVLFTSYSSLRRAYAKLEGPLRSLGFEPLMQGTTDRSSLLAQFKSKEGSVLFGTDSFWEGVDVKGDALRCVIITRLPFRVPSEPLQQARMEELQRRGRHPFSHFTVPQAVLKFKQGFGRLIRSTQDRGVVAVLDQRLLSKPYGKTFLQSLPETRRVTAPMRECVASVAEFFGHR